MQKLTCVYVHVGGKQKTKKNNMKFSTFLLITILFSSCVIMKTPEYNKPLQQQPKPVNASYNSDHDNCDFLKDRITEEYLKGNEICDLRFLLDVISKTMNKFEKIPIDEYRINKIKKELISVFKDYNLSNSGNPTFRITEEELKRRVRCYLDYMLDPKNEYVAWYEFWKDSYYRNLNCK